MRVRALLAVSPTVACGLYLAMSPDLATVPIRRLVGEVTGLAGLILLALALVLATRARTVERWVGGLDRAYRAHRYAAIAAAVVLAVHVATIPVASPASPGRVPGIVAAAGLGAQIILALSGRLDYDRWRVVHRLSGVFFVLGAVHALLVEPSLRSAPVAIAVLVVGAASYVYSLSWVGTTGYVVAAVRHLRPDVVEVTLRPSTRPLQFAAGQFVSVRFPGVRGLRRRHPFTISSGPDERDLRLTIKVAGDFTLRLSARLRLGMPARVAGPYGRFLSPPATGGRPPGGGHQVWVAGGIGITPFLSRIRNGMGADSVDLFYTVRQPADALHVDELRAAAYGSGLRLHLSCSSRDGRLTVAAIATASRADLRQTAVYLCGPASLVRTFRRDLRLAGVPAGSIHSELFRFR